MTLSLCLSSLAASGATVSEKEREDFFKFPTSISEKDLYQERLQCGVYAMHETPHADSEDSFGIEEHSVISDTGMVNLSNAKSGRMDVGGDILSAQEAQQYAANFPAKAFYRPIDRQHIVGGTRTYRITAIRNADMWVNSCPTEEQKQNESKDHTWSLYVEEGISLQVDLPDSYTYATIHKWIPVYQKKEDAEQGPMDGYKLHKTRIKNLDLYYRCTTYIPQCVG